MTNLQLEQEIIILNEKLTTLIEKVDKLEDRLNNISTTQTRFTSRFAQIKTPLR